MTPDRTVELAVAQALEMAAKVLRKRLDGIYEEHSYQEEDTGAVIVDRAYDSQAEILEEMEESIRALIPADIAAKARRQADRTIPFCIQVHGTRFNVGCKLSTVMDCIERAFRYFEEDAAQDTK